MKPKWDRYELADGREVDVRRDVDEDGIAFLDIQAVGATVAVRADASNHVRVYFWDQVRETPA